MAKKTRKRTTRNQPLPEEHQRKNQGLLAKAESFSGPLPPPAVLAQYNEVVPSAAERIIAMAENQARHRQELEKRIIESDTKNSRLGLHYGLIIGLAAVVGGVYCISSGYEVGGSIVGGTGLTGLVGVFVYGSRQKRKERERRFETEMASANPS
jgi:uncharacterized membrane protein